MESVLLILHSKPEEGEKRQKVRRTRIVKKKRSKRGHNFFSDTKDFHEGRPRIKVSKGTSENHTKSTPMTKRETEDGREEERELGEDRKREGNLGAEE